MNPKPHTERKVIPEFDQALKLLVLSVQRECRANMQDYDDLQSKHFALDRKHYCGKLKTLYYNK